MQRLSWLLLLPRHAFLGTLYKLWPSLYTTYTVLLCQFWLHRIQHDLKILLCLVSIFLTSHIFKNLSMFKQPMYHILIWLSFLYNFPYSYFSLIKLYKCLDYLKNTLTSRKKRNLLNLARHSVQKEATLTLFFFSWYFQRFTVQIKCFLTYA